MNWLDRLEAELRCESKPPPGAFTVEQIAAKIGRSPSATRAILRRKIEAGEMERVTVKPEGQRNPMNYYRPKNLPRLATGSPKQRTEHKNRISKQRVFAE